MEQAMQFVAEASDRSGATPRGAHQPLLKPGPSNLVRLNTISDSRAQGHCRGEEHSLVEKWPGLLERVQNAARHIRDVEDRAQQQDRHVQELLDQVHVDMETARARVQAAEQETRDVHAQATKLIQAAEERAAAAEQMLQRISETIEAEFVVPSSAQSADPAGVFHQMSTGQVAS